MSKSEKRTAHPLAKPAARKPCKHPVTSSVRTAFGQWWCKDCGAPSRHPEPKKKGAKRGDAAPRSASKFGRAVVDAFVQELREPSESTAKQAARDVAGPDVLALAEAAARGAAAQRAVDKITAAANGAPVVKLKSGRIVSNVVEELELKMRQLSEAMQEKEWLQGKLDAIEAIVQEIEGEGTGPNTWRRVKEIREQLDRLGDA
jgi:hypothetical protein